MNDPDWRKDMVGDIKIKLRGFLIGIVSLYVIIPLVVWVVLLYLLLKDVENVTELLRGILGILLAIIHLGERAMRTSFQSWTGILLNILESAKVDEAKEKYLESEVLLALPMLKSGDASVLKEIVKDFEDKGVKF